MDAADILGVKKVRKGPAFESALEGAAESSKQRKKAAAKPPNVSREVLALIGPG